MRAWGGLLGGLLVRALGVEADGDFLGEAGVVDLEEVSLRAAGALDDLPSRRGMGRGNPCTGPRLAPLDVQNATIRVFRRMA